MPTETIAAPQSDTTNSLKSLAAFCSVLALLFAGMFWVFNVNAKADGAVESSRSNATKIEQKADKDDVKEGFRALNEKFDHLQDYLMREHQRAGK